MHYRILACYSFTQILLSYSFHATCNWHLCYQSSIFFVLFFLLKLHTILVHLPIYIRAASKEMFIQFDLPQLCSSPFLEYIFEDFTRVGGGKKFPLSQLKVNSIKNKNESRSPDKAIYYCNDRITADDITSVHYQHETTCDQNTLRI